MPKTATTTTISSPSTRVPQLVYRSAAKAIFAEPTTMLQAVKAYAPTKSGREVARKAMTGAPAGAVLIAFKAESVDDVAREVVASSADRTTSTTKGTTSRAAMREGALDLATRIGQKGIVGGNGSAIGIDRNHRTPLDNDDVMLKAVWPGAGGIG